MPELNLGGGLGRIRVHKSDGQGRRGRGERA